MSLPGSVSLLARFRPAPGGGATGNVIGPASATDNEVPVFSGTTGKIIKVADGPITITAGGTSQAITLTPSGPDGAATVSGHFRTTSSVKLGGGGSLIAISAVNNVITGLPSAWTGNYGYGIQYSGGDINTFIGDGSGGTFSMFTRTGSANTSRFSVNGANGIVTIPGAPVGGVQALSGAGAINVTQWHTDYTSTGGAQALTLANGTAGQIKTICHVTDGGSGVLTPTTKTGFTTITFTNAGDSCTLRYSATGGWYIVGIFGAVAA